MITRSFKLYNSRSDQILIDVKILRFQDIKTDYNSKLHIIQFAQRSNPCRRQDIKILRYQDRLQLEGSNHIIRAAIPLDVKILRF
jgi:hypothetical protein